MLRPVYQRSRRVCSRWGTHRGGAQPSERGQASSRVPELVPIRHGRMLVSPFTFYRGAALPMAADLASTPSSGLRVQLCGDAHLCNFGAVRLPERRLVFDLNNVDETTPGARSSGTSRLVASLSVPPGKTASPPSSAASRSGRRFAPVRTATPACFVSSTRCRPAAHSGRAAPTTSSSIAGASARKARPR